MAINKRTQKQVADRLKGNLDYYKRPSPLRSLRGWLYFLSIVIGLGIAPAYYWLKGPEQIFNPGPISRAHSPIASDCASCHPQMAQVKARSNEVREILNEPYWLRIDQTCQTCHQGFALHMPNTINEDTKELRGALETNSCTSCHREHLTNEKMIASTETNCAACHNRADLQAASAERAKKIPARNFPGRKPDGLAYFKKDRPLGGYTQVFSKFDQGHPSFQIHEQKLKDPNPMRFNHQRHHQDDIPKTEKGVRLMDDCAYCHKPDGRGNFQKLTFDNSCRSCHAIKLDPNTPGIEVPHGRPEEVREFLRAIDIKYLEYFTKKEGPVRGRELASKAIISLRNVYGVQSSDGSLTKLEQQIFYNGVAPSGGNNPFNRTLNTNERAQFTGCAYCHTVSPMKVNSTPEIAKCMIPDRWLSNGEFNHAKHGMQTCTQCHDTIPKSRETSDINIPKQQSCTECHNSGARGVKNDCQSCHHYHAPGYKTVNAPKLAEGATPGSSVAMSTREMMLGK